MSVDSNLIEYSLKIKLGLTLIRYNDREADRAVLVQHPRRPARKDRVKVGSLKMATDIDAAPQAVDGPRATRATPRKAGKTTKEAILAAAEVVFAKSGYHGASTVDIAKQAKCYESLIYYHFGNKDKLFAAVLENAYRKLVAAEQELEVDYDDPKGALAEVVLFMWRYYHSHPELIILLNTENSLKGKHVKQSSALGKFLPNAIRVLQSVVEAGVRHDVFRSDVNVDDLYITVMGLGYFYLSNRYTLTAFFGKDLMAAAERERWERTIVETVFNSVKKIA